MGEIRPQTPLSPDDPPESKNALVAYERIETAIDLHDEWDDIEDVLDDISTLSELESRVEETEAKTDAAHRKADNANERLDAHSEMFKTLFGLDARREATDSVYEEFFPTPTDGRSQVAMARRRALMQWLVREAGEDNEDLSRLYKKKVNGRSPDENAQRALRAADLTPPSARTVENDLKALVDAVPGAVWRQDGEKGQNRKALLFSLEKFVQTWDGDADK